MGHVGWVVFIVWSEEVGGGSLKGVLGGVVEFVNSHEINLTICGMGWAMPIVMY